MRKYGQLQMVLFAVSNIDLELPPEAKEKGLIQMIKANLAIVHFGLKHLTRRFLAFKRK